MLSTLILRIERPMDGLREDLVLCLWLVRSHVVVVHLVLDCMGQGVCLYFISAFMNGWDLVFTLLSNFRDGLVGSSQDACLCYLAFFLTHWCLLLLASVAGLWWDTFEFFMSVWSTGVCLTLVGLGFERELWCLPFFLLYLPEFIAYFTHSWFLWRLLDHILMDFSNRLLDLVLNFLLFLGSWSYLGHQRIVVYVLGSCRWVLHGSCRWVLLGSCRWVLLGSCRWVLLGSCRWVLLGSCRWVLLGSCRWSLLCVSVQLLLVASNWFLLRISLIRSKLRPFFRWNFAPIDLVVDSVCLLSLLKRSLIFCIVLQDRVHLLLQNEMVLMAVFL